MSTIETNKFQRTWVDALRSGKYMQAHQVLMGEVYEEVEDDDVGECVGIGYCCLGVGIDVDPEIKGFDDGHRPGEEIPTAEVMARWGLPSMEATYLALMNDNLDPPSDFNEIADYIEAMDMIPYEVTL